MECFLQLLHVHVGHGCAHVDVHDHVHDVHDCVYAHDYVHDGYVCAHDHVRGHDRAHVRDRGYGHDDVSLVHLLAENI